MLLENLDRLHNLAARFDLQLADINRVLDYLVRYGYLKINPLSFALDLATTVQKILDAVKEFRERAGLPSEGILKNTIDTPTLIKMTEPRCGFPDVQRVAVAEARWRKNKLTYYVESYVNGMTRADQDDLMRLAWNDWMAIANITLTQVASRSGADIVISTGRGSGQNFDGPNGTLAWAYLPTGNDQQLLMRFDLDERWMRDNPQAGILLRNVACHEFGHLLGLDHSRVPSALMAPFYSPAIPKPQANDDVQRIQALYGPATVSPPPPPPPPPDGKTTITLEVVGKDARITSVV